MAAAIIDRAIDWAKRTGADGSSSAGRTGSRANRYATGDQRGPIIPSSTSTAATITTAGVWNSTASRHSSPVMAWAKRGAHG